jgi:carbon monoxide dehydrogenase subunit G
VVDKITPQCFKLMVDVNAKIGIISAEVVLSVTPEEESTSVSFVGDGKLSGKLAQMGSRMLTPVARMFTKMFFRQLVKEAKKK